MPFGEPEIAGGPYPKELLGHLLMVWAVEYIEDAPSKFSNRGAPSDVIVVDMVDLNEVEFGTNEAGVLSRGAWWRGGRLIGSLKRRLGKPDPVLAWMRLGTASAGFNAPYELVSATSDPESVRRAQNWLDAHPDFTPTVPRGSDRPEPIRATPGAANSPRPSAQEVPESNPEPEVETSAPNRIRSQLEQMAKQSQRGADRLPASPEKFPY